MMKNKLLCALALSLALLTGTVYAAAPYRGVCGILKDGLPPQALLFVRHCGRLE